jgi:hypothetical protein
VPPDDVAQRRVRGIVRLVREPLVEAAEYEARPPVVSLYDRKAGRYGVQERLREHALDEALEATFPASDPITVSGYRPEAP